MRNQPDAELPPTQDEPADFPVIIIGSGGHAKVLLDLLALLGRRVLFITDREPSRHGQYVGSVEVRGADEIILQQRPDQIRLVNAVGSIALPSARRDVYQRFRGHGYHFETLVHPSAVVARTATLGEGVQIMAGAIIQTGVRIFENALINTAASVDHDCLIRAHTHIAPGATLSGSVQVGEMCHVGTAASIIQGVQIGAASVVGAGALVLRDVLEHTKVIGVPAQVLRGSGAMRTTAAADQKPYTVMLSAAGRRVALMKLIRTSLQDLGLSPRVLATDVTVASAAFHLGDVARIVPRYSDPDCLEKLLDLCREFNVRLIMPTIDPDLPFFSEHRAKFESIGTQIMVSSPETIRICNDKKATHQWLVDTGFPTMRQIDADKLADGVDDWPFPVFIKPTRGSSSFGARTVRDHAELSQAIRDGDFIAQDIAPGHEYTVDVFVDRHGRCRCTVPRLRMETRGGEVTKSMTVRSEPIEAMARRVAEALPGASGVMNIQIFHDESTGALNVSEINPRFGGGYPLTHQAGAPMARWVLEELLGQDLTDHRKWIDGLVMLRYDDAVFVQREEANIVIPVGGASV